MASPVPYSGAPNNTLQQQGISPIHEDTPLGAFGGAVAGAISSVGQTEEGVGKEVFERAIAMQQLNVQAEANSALADYQNQASQKYLDYTSKQGKDAVDGLGPFNEDTEKLRQQIGSNISSPYGQFLFNQESRNSRFRFVFSAGMHAKEQNKQFVMGSSDARIAAAGNAALADPTNEEGFKAGMATVRAEANSKADIKGLPQDDPQRQQLVQNDVSNYTAQRVRGLAKLQPFQASKVLEDSIARGDIIGPEVGQLRDFVNRQRYTVGARQGTAQVMSGGDLSFGERILPSDQARAGIKGVEGGDYSAPSTLTKSDGSTVQRGIGAYQIMPSNLGPWLKEAGMAPMSEKEFIANHSAQDQLFDFKFGQYMQEYGSFNNAAKAWFTGTATPREGISDAFGTTVPSYLKTANAALAKNAPLKDLDATGQRLALTLAPDDPMFGEYMTQNIEMQYNRERTIQRDNEFQNTQTVYKALVGGGPDGKMPTTVDDLRKDDAVGTAYDAMKSTDQLKVMNILNRNAKGDVAMTEPRQARYQELVGMAVHSPDQFLDTDVLNEDLPWASKKELIGMQTKVYQKADADPAVSRALGILSDKLDAAGYTKTGDKEGLEQFTGALRGALEAFQETNKRPPKEEEVELMGTKLLQKSGGGWFTGGTEMFKVPVPKEAADFIRNDPKWAQWGVEPTEQDIERLYARAQFDNFYSKKVAAP